MALYAAGCDHAASDGGSETATSEQGNGGSGEETTSISFEGQTVGLAAGADSSVNVYAAGSEDLKGRWRLVASAPTDHQGRFVVSVEAKPPLLLESEESSASLADEPVTDFALEELVARGRMALVLSTEGRVVISPVSAVLASMAFEKFPAAADPMQIIDQLAAAMAAALDFVKQTAKIPGSFDPNDPVAIAGLSPESMQVITSLLPSPASGDTATDPGTSGPTGTTGTGSATGTASATASGTGSDTGTGTGSGTGTATSGNSDSTGPEGLEDLSACRGKVDHVLSSADEQILKAIVDRLATKPGLFISFATIINDKLPGHSNLSIQTRPSWASAAAGTSFVVSGNDLAGDGASFNQPHAISLTGTQAYKGQAIADPLDSGITTEMPALHQTFFLNQLTLPTASATRAMVVLPIADIGPSEVRFWSLFASTSKKCAFGILATSPSIGVNFIATSKWSSRSGVYKASGTSNPNLFNIETTVDSLLVAARIARDATSTSSMPGSMPTDTVEYVIASSLGGAEYSKISAEEHGYGLTIAHYFAVNAAPGANGAALPNTDSSVSAVIDQNSATKVTLNAEVPVYGGSATHVYRYPGPHDQSLISGSSYRCQQLYTFLMAGVFSSMPEGICQMLGIPLILLEPLP